MRTMSLWNIRGDGYLLRAVSILLLAVTLGGCATQNMAPTETIYRSAEANSLFKESIAVTLRGTSPNKLEAATIQTLKDIGWSPQGSAALKFILKIEIISETAPPMTGYEISGSVKVKYVLAESKFNSIFFDQTIETYAKAGVSDVFSGADRRSYVINKYANLNITEFIRRLDQYAKTSNKNFAPSKVPQLVETEKYLVEKLKFYDIFSTIPFYIAYPPDDYRNYHFSNLWYPAKSVLEPKLQNASLQQLKTFQNVYREQLLNTTYSTFLSNLIAEKEREAEKQGDHTGGTPRPPTAQKPVPKAQKSSNTDSSNTNSQPAPKIEGPAKAEPPKKAQPAPNPF